MACGEFSLIARYFDRVRSSRLDVELGIGDDCALLNIPRNRPWRSALIRWWRATIFLPDINPADLAYKALAVNLSDLAAMGADSGLADAGINLTGRRRSVA
ncbi:AIR synthase related protein [Escherichia coli]